MLKINTDILSRLVMAALLFYAPLTWITSHDSIAGQMGRVQPDHGALLVATMFVLAVAVVIDVVFNSMLNCPVKWSWAVRHRDLLYMVGAFCSITVLFSVVKYTSLKPGAIYLYVILFFVCLAHGILDSNAKRPCSHPKIERRKFIREKS